MYANRQPVNMEVSSGIILAEEFINVTFGNIMYYLTVN